MRSAVAESKVNAGYALDVMLARPAPGREAYGLSVEAMAWALHQQVGSPTAKLVLLGLANHADHDGSRSYPGNAVLAVYANTTVRSVRRAKRDLERDGFIVRAVWQPDHIRADRRPDCYDLPAVRGDDMSGRDGSRGDISDRHGGTYGAARGDTGVPLTVLEPSKDKPSKDTLSTDVDAEAEQSFREFWDVYPKRNGKKLGKNNAMIEWRKLNRDQRRRAWVGAKHLAASDQLPKDPERFLRRAKGGKGEFPFEDWQEPAVPDVRDGGRAARNRAAADEARRMLREAEARNR